MAQKMDAIQPQCFSNGVNLFYAAFYCPKRQIARTIRPSTAKLVEPDDSPSLVCHGLQRFEIVAAQARAAVQEQYWRSGTLIWMISRPDTRSCNLGSLQNPQ